MSTIPGGRRWLAAMSLPAAQLLTAECGAIVVSAPAPTTTVSTYVPASLGPGQFLVPTVATNAAGPQDWRFDLHFDPPVVQWVDLSGFHDGVFGAQFDALQAELSSITSSGFLLNRRSQVAGFSGGLSGNGLLAHVAFAYRPRQRRDDPGVNVGDVTATQPEPGSLALVSAALLPGHRSAAPATSHPKKRRTPHDDHQDPLRRAVARPRLGSRRPGQRPDRRERRPLRQAVLLPDPARRQPLHRAVELRVAGRARPRNAAWCSGACRAPTASTGPCRRPWCSAASTRKSTRWNSGPAAAWAGA